MSRIALAALVCALIALVGCTTVWVAPTGLDSNAGTQTSPKKSFAGACGVPADGRLVFAKQGVYPEQVIPPGCGRTLFVEDGQATLRASSASSTTPVLAIEANDIYVGGLTVDSNGLKRKGVHSNGDRVLLRSMDIGNVTDDKPIEAWGTDFRLENSYVHDAAITNSFVHSECLFAVGTERIHITGSTFRGCATYDVSLTRCTWCSPQGPQWGNGVVEGNTFYHSHQGDPGSWHYNAFAFYGGTSLADAHGWTVRNNRFETRNLNGDKRGGIALDIPWVNGTRCGNTEFPADVGVLDNVWKQPC